MKPLNSKKGYTLIELLVVIGIIALLVTISIPVVNGVITTTKLKNDNNKAKAFSSTISLWMTEQSSTAPVYSPVTENVIYINDFNRKHTISSYSQAYMGTQQLPGVEYETESFIRNSAICAIISLTQEEFIEEGNNLYLPSPSASGYGYKYYYRTGLVSVEKVSDDKNLHNGGEYQYYIWLDKQTKQGVTTGDTIDKIEKNEEVSDVNRGNEAFSFLFSLPYGSDATKYRFEISNDNCSYTLNGEVKTPQIFTFGKYQIKHYISGVLQGVNIVQITTSTNGEVVISFDPNNPSELSFTTSLEDFTLNGTKIIKYNGSDSVVITPTHNSQGQKITSISSNAFDNNSSLKRLIISEAENIDEYSINNCSNLVYIELPCPNLSSYAISSCTNVTEINFSTKNFARDTSEIRYIWTDAIHNCPKVKDIFLPFLYKTIAFVPNGITVTSQTTPEMQTFTTSNIDYYYPSEVCFKKTPNGMALNPIEAQKYCMIKEKTTFNFPAYFGKENTKAVNILAFSSTSGCEDIHNIQTLNIDEGYQKIGDNSFENLKIKNLSLPSTLNQIGNEAFYGNNLKTLTIPQNVTFVGKKAFSSTTLKTIVIECDLIAFTKNSLSGCEQVSTVIIKNYTGDKEAVTPQKLGFKNTNPTIIFSD